MPEALLAEFLDFRLVLKIVAGHLLDGCPADDPGLVAHALTVTGISRHGIVRGIVLVLRERLVGTVAAVVAHEFFSSGLQTAARSGSSDGSAAAGARRERLVARRVCPSVGRGRTATGDERREVEIAVRLEDRAGCCRALGSALIARVQGRDRRTRAAAVCAAENSNDEITRSHWKSPIRY